MTAAHDLLIPGYSPDIYDLYQDVCRRNAELVETNKQLVAQAEMRAQPSVSPADHRRACDARDEALAKVQEQHEEIRQLNEALTQANERAVARIADAKADRNAAIHELDVTRDALTSAQCQLDTWAGAMSAQEDSQAIIARATNVLADVMATLAASAGGPSETWAWDRARAFLAEMGHVPKGFNALREAHEKWEARRK